MAQSVPGQAPASFLRLARVPHLPGLMAAASLGVFAERMAAMAIVLIVLERFDSPTLAGMTTLLLTAPGLALSPVAGALLDRGRRPVLIALDYGVAALGLVAVGTMLLANRLSPPLVLAIVTGMSLSTPLSRAGTRSLFPSVVPSELWDRVNAVDSGRYTLATIGGPALAGLLLDHQGAAVTMLVTACLYLVAAALVISAPDRPADDPGTGILKQSWLAIAYVWRNPSLRGLAISLFPYNVGLGALMIALPTFVIGDLHWSATAVGGLWALSGAASLCTGLIAARFGSSGRERLLMIVGASAWMAGALLVGIGTLPQRIVLAMVAVGIGTGLLDLGVFGLRQRRTRPSMLGRAFSVSISLNMVGIPTGSALAGLLSERPRPEVFVLAALASTATAVLTLTSVPRHGQAPSPDGGLPP